MVAVVPQPVEAAARSHGLGELLRRSGYPSNFALIFIEWTSALSMVFTVVRSPVLATEQPTAPGESLCRCWATFCGGATSPGWWSWVC
jgi:hypothetical protein